METVLDALKAMEKATAREIAARMKTELVDVLVELQQALEDGEVGFEHGYWSLSGIAPAKTVKRETPKPEAPKESTVKIGEPQMLDVIREYGPQTAEDLATLLGITSRKVTSTLAMATGKGRLTRVNRDGKYWYCLPEPEPEPEPEAAPAAESVPEVDKPQDGQTLPTPKEISRVIRKLKSALHQAEQARESILAVKKHKKSLDRMTKLLQELQS
ncbi:DUF1627 domain-containing protein [Salmonella enterica]|nr:DUF1627 domain-containing protein [Salmonella enterica]MDJ7048475.1 DUF1627 domain-containing protein [Salmonella enterica]MDJ7337163.1 DUF1627 domain-containing protein [Salmonella enterica]